MRVLYQPGKPLVLPVFNPKLPQPKFPWMLPDAPPQVTTDEVVTKKPVMETTPQPSPGPASFETVPTSGQISLDWVKEKLSTPEGLLVAGVLLWLGWNAIREQG